jgi:hypothetical protein
MIDKKLKGGLTYKGAIKTVEYLLNDRVEKGTAKVIDGNVKLTLLIIQMVSKRHSRCWSSGVLSFEETISEDVAKEIIEEHKRVTYCGMKPSQYNSLYVLHTDKGRSELHYIFPRIELSTGKVFNPYYVKRDFIKKDLFQDYINAKYGLSSPKQSQSRELVTKNKKKWANKKSTIQKEIDEAVSNLVNSGVIQSRDDIINFLRENDFEINRVRRESVSVLHKSIKRKDGTLDPISLKGPIYGENFTDWGRLEESITQEDKRTRRTFEDIGRELDSIIRSQALCNGKRFKEGEGAESETVSLAKSNALEDGTGLQVRDGGWESKSHIDEYKNEPIGQIKEELDYDSVRTVFERSRRESEECRTEINRKRTEALAGLKRLANELYRQRSTEAGGEATQRSLADRIREYFSPNSTVSPETYRARALGHYTEIEELDSVVRESLSIEGEFEQFKDIYKGGIRELADIISYGIRERIESIARTLERLGNKIGRYLEELPVREARKRNAEKRARRAIESILIDDKIDYINFPKPKR